MSDPREPRRLAVAARKELTRGVEARLRDLLATKAPLAACTAHAALAERVRRAGRHARGRAVVAEDLAYALFVRAVVLHLLTVRGWQEPVTDAETSARAWATWSSRLPALRVIGEDTALLALATPPEHWGPTGVPGRLRALITPGEHDAPATLGWLHQHYFTEHRRHTYARLASAPVDGPNLAAVTQVFTPEWVARTLLDNSVGLHTPEVPGSHLLRADPDAGRPAEPDRSVPDGGVPSVLDPACGAGHLLLPAFDQLCDLHEARGLDARAAVEATLTDRLWGLDVDPRVVALASTSLTLRAWDRLGGPVDGLPAPQVHTLLPIRFTRPELRRLPHLDPEADRTLSDTFWHQFADADVLGPLVRSDVTHTETASTLLTETDLSTLAPELRDRVRRVLHQARLLTRRHDVVVANPPYLGTRHMGPRLRALATALYPETKGDLCTMFLERTLELLVPGGLAAVVASESWFVTTRTRRVRDLLLSRAHLRTAVCIDAAAFGVRLNTVATVLQVPVRAGDPAPDTLFTRVGRDDLAAATPQRLPVPGRTVQRRHVSAFDAVPDRVLVFDLPPSLLALYAKGVVLGDVVGLRQGMATTDNARFVRRWWEVPADEVQRGLGPGERHHSARWVPYNKGGSAVRWWGNQEYVVLWEDDARALREVRPAATIEDQDFFRSSVSWSNIGRNGVQFRIYPDGFVFDVAGMSAFVDDERTRLNLLGYLNSPLVRAAMDVLAPTLNYQVGDVARLPAPELSTGEDHHRVAELVALTRALWAQEHTSWEHEAHPLLLRNEATLEARARAHVREREATLARIRDLETASAHYWADRVQALTGVVVTERDPGPTTLPPTRDVAALVAEAELLTATGARALDPRTASSTPAA
ncbi:Eco57I restriction-modification methylase domain-containing protein [Nocardioides yefusunii]|uniref:site-specific DNA-methyltransferase (adenine-specific) n=1 Tax=Nocardioides yefusunii TaxID=2500546 RepID=A0ABW1QTN1_9ACTN|nr:N-6 DNA methylase [Nocardioides yefusunii]